METQIIDAQSPYLEAVKTLWRASSATLGFFTKGAFEEYANRKQIIIALNQDQICIGYVLYRITGNHATIVHLCVDESVRGQGVARLLFHRLRDETHDLFGIGLRCRQDFEANKIWPKFYFVKRGEVSGRGKDGAKLTCWWYTHERPTLFTDLEAEILSTKLCVVLDANVFFDLFDPLRPDYEESRSLLAEWLFDVELCLTDEIFNEIDRNTDREQKQKEFELAKRFPIYPCETKKRDVVDKRIRKILLSKRPENSESESLESDIRQLTRAIAADIKFFVTRDTEVLNAAEEIYQEFGVSVARPSDFITRLDELQREDEYQPARLAGVLDSHIRRVQSGEEDLLAARFHCHQKRETKKAFQKKLRPLLANPQKHTCHLAVDNDGNPLVLMAYEENPESKELVINLFRVAPHKLANTLTRYFSLRAVFQTARQGNVFTRVADPYLTESLAAVLAEDRFFQTENGWIKVSPSVTASAASLADQIRQQAVVPTGLEKKLAAISDVLGKPNIIYEARSMAEIEHLLWPAKIADAHIPTFIVPIRPEWAKELFDEDLAKQSLFGASKELALNREAVYYRSRQNSGGLCVPGRVLWYVSRRGKGKYSGEGQLRACSRLDEVTIGFPKELYRRFKRLGVYEWKHVYEVAKQDVENKIMAFRFSNTELFPYPLDFEKTIQLLEEESIKTQLQSPVRINPNAFAKLYIAANDYEKNKEVYA
jgi:GNAT superfamily N-acetyltransferase